MKYRDNFIPPLEGKSHLPGELFALRQYTVYESLMSCCRHYDYEFLFLQHNKLFSIKQSTIHVIFIFHKSLFSVNSGATKCVHHQTLNAYPSLSLRLFEEISFKYFILA